MQRIKYAVFAFLTLLPSATYADHWKPAPTHLGIPQEIVDYLHSEVPQGDVYTTMTVSCKERRIYCDAVRDHMAMVTFYRMKDARDTGGSDWLGTGYFEMQTLEPAQLGSLMMFVYGPGRYEGRSWHKPGHKTVGTEK
jgi:hypothetical protein